MSVINRLRDRNFQQSSKSQTESRHQSHKEYAGQEYAGQVATKYPLGYLNAQITINWSIL